jgi:hypothetical protein
VAPKYDIINLGGGRNPVSLQAVIAMIEQALGKRTAIAGQAFIGQTSRRHGPTSQRPSGCWIGRHGSSPARAFA